MKKEERFDPKHIEAQLRELGYVSGYINQFYNNWGYDPTVNWANREYCDFAIVHRYNNQYKKIVCGGKKYDYEDHMGDKGENKSGFIKKSNKNNKLLVSGLTWEFDKQNDPIRRKETLDYTSFTFSAYIRGSMLPEFIIYINTHSGIQSIRNIIENKQKEKINEIQQAKNQSKRLSRDSIQIKIKDLLSLSQNEYVVLDKNSNIISFANFVNMIKI